MEELSKKGTDTGQMTGQERKKWNKGNKTKRDMGNGNEVME